MNRIVYLSLIVALLVSPSAVSAQGRNRFGDATLRQGTNVRMRLQDNLDSNRNRNGDQFQAILDQALVSNNGRVLARTGSTVFVRLVDVQAGWPGNRSRVSLTVTGIQVDSSVIPIETNTVTVGTAPNKNQTVNFRLARDTNFDASRDQYGAAGRGERGRIDVIARELDSRAQYMFEAIRTDRGSPRTTSELYSAAERFANGARTFSQSRDFRSGAARQAASSLVSQAEQISRLMARNDGASRFRNEWRMVEE